MTNNEKDYIGPTGKVIAECVYCQEPKRVKVWEETGELVCFDCRLSLLEQEFED